MTARIVYGMPEVDYHSHPAINQSRAKLILEEGGPALYKANIKPPASPYMDMGSAAHGLLLGAGSKPVDMGTAVWRGKQAELVDQVRAAGEVPLKTPDYRAVDAMHEEAKAHPLITELLADGDPEVSLFATDPDTGLPLRGRIDWLSYGYAVDYKTVGKDAASGKRFAGHAVDYGYCMQAAWYLRLAELCGQPLTAWFWIVQERVEPYRCHVMQASDLMLQLGRQQMRKALTLISQCTAADHWPGFESVTVIDPPAWALRDLELDDELDAQLSTLETLWRQSA